MIRSRTVMSCLLAVAVLAPPAIGAALFRCGMTGEVHAAGCCCSEERPHSCPEAESPPCCELVAQNADHRSAAAEASSETVRVPLATAAVILAASTPAPLVRPQPMAPRECRGPPSDRAIWLHTCSFLI